MYPIALDCGVPVGEYWDLTLQEIVDIIEAYKRRQTRDKKSRVEEAFVLAEVIANRVGMVFGGKKSDSDVLWPWHFYPDLFEDKSEEIEEKREQIETEMLKIQLNSRVEAWNKRFEEEHKNDS